MTNYIGVDVGKLSLEIYIPAKQDNYQVSNNSKGFTKLLKHLSKHYQDSEIMLVFEATGGLRRL
jgi:transposase